MALTVDELEALRQQAERDAATGKHAAAAIAYRKLLDAQPDDADARLGCVRALISDQQLDAADVVLHELGEPTDGRLLSELGRLHYLRHDFDAAADALARASAARPDDGHIKANYGFALWENGERSKALDALREALPLVRDDAHLSGNMGQIFMQLGMWNEAISSFERYLLDFPNDLDRRVLLAFCLNESGWTDEAETVVQEALSLNPDLESAKELADRIRSGAAQAPAVGTPAFEIDESLFGALGTARRGAPTETIKSFPPVGEPESSVRFGASGIEVTPSSAPKPAPPFAFDNDALSDFADVQVVDDEAERRQIALDLAQRVGEYLDNDDVNGAIAFLERERATSKAPAEVLNVLAKTLVEQEDYELALDCLREASELDPFHPEVHSNLGVLLWQTGEFDPAIEALRTAVELDTEDMNARINLALICQQIGLFEESSTLFAQYLDQFPEDTAIRMELARAYIQLSENDAALRELDTILLLEPEHADAQKLFDDLSNA